MQALRGLLAPFDKVSSVDVREVDRGVMVTLAVEDPEAPEVAALVGAIRGRVPGLVTLSLSRRGFGSPRVLGRSPSPVAGTAAERHTPDPKAPYHYAAPGSFTQAHPGQLIELHRHVERLLGEHLGSLQGRRLLELYAGAGALGLRLARAGARVTLVERFQPASELAVRAAVEQGLTVEARAADARAALERFVAQERRFDAALVNPPRRGLDPAVRRAIAALHPGVVVYVSCEPDTLARDLAHLALLGYGLTEVHPYDMIPLSEAVETLATLVPAEVGAPRVLHADGVLIAVDKPPHEPVLPLKGHPSSLLERVRRFLAAPEAIPVSSIETEMSGVCLLARGPAGVADLTRAWVTGERSYVALAQGITHGRGTFRHRLRLSKREVPAVTRYRRQSVAGGHSLVTVMPEQDHPQQIQRHFADVGRPLVGDPRFGDPRTNRHFEHRHGLDRPFLHLERVRLRVGSIELELHSMLPPDLASVLESLRAGASTETPH